MGVSYGWRELGHGLQELCDECGFDARYVIDEAARLDACLGALSVALMQENAEVAPAPGVWSAREYGAHCLDMVGETISVVRDGRPEPRAKVDDLDDATRQLHALSEDLGAGARGRTIDLGGAFPVTPQWMMTHLLHDLEHHLLDIRRGYAAIALGRAEGPTVVR